MCLCRCVDVCVTVSVGGEHVWGVSGWAVGACVSVHVCACVRAGCNLGLERIVNEPVGWTAGRVGEGLLLPSWRARASPHPRLRHPAEPQFGATNAFAGVSNAPRPRRREQRRPGQAQVPRLSPGHLAPPARASSRRRGWASPSRAPQVQEDAGAARRRLVRPGPPRSPRRRERRGRRRGQQAGCGLGSGAALGVLQGAKINPAKDQVSRPK